MVSPQPDDKSVGGVAPTAVVPVDERLGLALTAASRAMESRYRTSLTRLQLTYSQFQVMSVLWEDGSHVVGTLADRLALDVSTISPLLKRLESRGLVVRRRDERDERRVVVTPTELGMALRSEEGAILDQVSVGTHLTSAQERSLVRQLHRLASFLGS